MQDKKYAVHCSNCSTYYFPTIIGYSVRSNNHGLCYYCKDHYEESECEFSRLKAIRDIKEQRRAKFVNELINLPFKNEFKFKRMAMFSIIKDYNFEIDEISKKMLEKYGKAI